MIFNCCLAGRLFLPLLLLGGNVLAMDERGTAAGSDNEWSIVSAPPPPGPYRSVNVDPRIPGQDVVPMPDLSHEMPGHSPLPAEALRTPPAAGRIAPEPAPSGGQRSYAAPYPGEAYPSPPRSRDYPPAPLQQDYAQPPHSREYVPQGRGTQDYYAPSGRSGGYRSSPYTHDYPAQPDYGQPPRSADRIPPPPGAYEQPSSARDYIPPPPGAYDDYDQQAVPGPYGRGMQRAPSYDYSRPDRYQRQPAQQGYRMPPPGYYSPTTQRPLQDAPQPPIYDSMMGQPSGGSAYEDASRRVPQ